MTDANGGGKSRGHRQENLLRCVLMAEYPYTTTRKIQLRSFAIQNSLGHQTVRGSHFCGYQTNWIFMILQGKESRALRQYERPSSQSIRSL